MKNNVTIIMYHYVRDLANSRFPEIKGLDSTLFTEQVKYLSTHYNVITMDELIDCIDNNTQLPVKSALLTFDDGYFDHFDCVMPVLAKHKMQGSFFPPAKAILHNIVLDVNKIHFILASVKDKMLLVNELFSKLDEYHSAYGLDSNETYFKKHAVAGRKDPAEVMFIKQMLQVILPENLRQILCNYFFNKYVTADEASFSRELYMSIEQIKNLKENGMHIGSHGYDHYWLGSLSKEKQEIEIERSLEFLKLVGSVSNGWTMCYPYGNYNKDTLDILNSKGCKVALTTRADIAGLKEYKRFELPRLDTNEIPFNGSAATNDWYDKA
ncbi:MAG: polysaccharide deacetylase family protein [Ferruginibacter sp.]